MRFLFYIYLIIGFLFAHNVLACDWRWRADELISDSFKSINGVKKNSLKEYHFYEQDPANIFENIKTIASDISDKIVKSSKGCDDNYHMSIFSSNYWGWRAVVHLMSKKARGARERDLEIVEPIIGYAADLLNQTAPLPINDAKCYTRQVSSAGFYPSASKAWYRYRVLGWIKCDDGSYRAYLPETGWEKATSDQVSAILSSYESANSER